MAKTRRKQVDIVVLCVDDAESYPACCLSADCMRTDDGSGAEAEVTNQELMTFDSEQELYQPLVLYIGGTPLYAIIRPSSDAHAVGEEQCRELLAQRAIEEQDIPACSKEFARSILPHINELRQVRLSGSYAMCHMLV